MKAGPGRDTIAGVSSAVRAVDLDNAQLVTSDSLGTSQFGRKSDGDSTGKDVRQVEFCSTSSVSASVRGD